MKKIFILEGLDCANCAAKIERAVASLDGVTSASVSFMTLKMVIEGEDSQMDNIIKKAKKIIRRQEPDVVVREA